MTARIRCNKCEAESYYDGKTKIYCPTCFTQLEGQLERMTDIANKEHASSAHIAMRNGELEAENERLRIAGRRLLSVLPDSVAHENHDCWRWCWDELDGDGQDEVKAARNLWEKALRGE